MSLQIAPRIGVFSTNGAVERERLEARVKEINVTSQRSNVGLGSFQDAVKYPVLELLLISAIEIFLGRVCLHERCTVGEPRQRFLSTDRLSTPRHQQGNPCHNSEGFRDK